VLVHLRLQSALLYGVYCCKDVTVVACCVGPECRLMVDVKTLRYVQATTRRALR